MHSTLDVSDARDRIKAEIGISVHNQDDHTTLTDALSILPDSKVEKVAELIEVLRAENSQVTYAILA